jgi:hypothetical protein
MQGGRGSGSTEMGFVTGELALECMRGTARCHLACGMLADSEAMSVGGTRCLIPLSPRRWHRRQVLNSEAAHIIGMPQCHNAAGNATSGLALCRCLGCPCSAYAVTRRYP